MTSRHAFPASRPGCNGSSSSQVTRRPIRHIGGRHSGGFVWRATAVIVAWLIQFILDPPRPQPTRLPEPVTAGLELARMAPRVSICERIGGPFAPNRRTGRRRIRRRRQAWKLRMASNTTGGALSVDDHDIHSPGPSRNHLRAHGGRKHRLRAGVDLFDIRYVVLGSRFAPDAPAHEPRVSHRSRTIEGAARNTLARHHLARRDAV